jgi:hypothetical protein
MFMIIAALTVTVSCGESSERDISAADNDTLSEDALNNMFTSETLTEYIGDLQTGCGYAENIYIGSFGNGDRFEQTAYYYPSDERYDENQKSWCNYGTGEYKNR